MTFSRLLPVFKRLQLLPWMSLSLGIVVLIIFVTLNSTATQNPPVPLSKESSANSTEWQTQVSEKLKSIKAEATTLKDKLSDVGPANRSGTESNPNDSMMVTGLSRSMTGGSSEGGGFQKVAGKGSNEVYIPMGSVFRAQLLMPIKTSIQETFVMAQTTHEFRFDNDSVRSIPVGSRLVGRAQLNPLLKGVMVRFHTLVTPRGIEYPVSVIALSKDLFAELNGIYFSNDVETYGAILAFGAVEGFANASRDYDNRFLVPTGEKSVSNNVWAGVSGASFRLTEQLLQEIQNRRVEYVVVPSGDKIFLVFDQRFIIKDKKPIR